MTKDPRVYLARGVLDNGDPRLNRRVMGKLAADLREAFPEMKGFSRRNPWYMRSSAAAWPERESVQAKLAQSTWLQNIALLEKVGGPGERLGATRRQQQIENTRLYAVMATNTAKIRRLGDGG